MIGFQKLLEIIKKYRDSEDYFLTTSELGSHSTGKTYDHMNIYHITSPDLKKEAREIIFFGGLKDENIAEVSTTLGEKEYRYKKGGDNQPDELRVYDIDPQVFQKAKQEAEERKGKYEKDREQWRHSYEQLERDKEEFRRRSQEGEKSPQIKKCDFCNKEIDPAEGTTSIGSPSREKGRLYFCIADNCLEQYYNQKNKENDNPTWEEKVGNCASCGKVANWENDWQYFVSDGKIYCGDCVKNKRQKTELELVQVKLNTLKSKLQNSSNPDERKRLEEEITKTQDHLKDLENKSKNNPHQSGSPKKGYGNIILIGTVIFSVVILALTLIINKRKKNKKSAR